MKSSQFSFPLKSSSEQNLHNPMCSARVVSLVDSAQYGDPYEMKNNNKAINNKIGVNFFSFVNIGSPRNPEVFAVKSFLKFECIFCFFEDPTKTLTFLSDVLSSAFSFLHLQQTTLVP